MKAFRLFVSLLVALSWAVQPVYADRFVFRYTSGLVSSGPGTPVDPGEPSETFDITARFVAITGQPVDVSIPLRPGANVAQWRSLKGSLPEGVVLDPATGKLTGVPGLEQKTALSLQGYGPDGVAGTKASVSFDVYAPRPYATKVDLYAHAGRQFVETVVNSGRTVYQWTALTALPSWMSASSSIVQGTPPADGQGIYAIALAGKDFSGEEIAFVYGTVTVEDGPTVAFIPDVERHPSDLFDIVGRVDRTMGELKWAIEGDPLQANLRLSPSEGRIVGTVPAFETAAKVRLIAQDVDGTSGNSNWFTISTPSPEVALSDAPDRKLTVGVPSSFGFHADDLVGPVGWSISEGALPEGMSIDGTTGVISGTPAKVERQEGVVVAVTSSGGDDQSRPFSIEVFAAPITVATKSMDVRVGTPFETEPPAVTGATAPWTFALASGAALSDGLVLDSATGVVRGSASEAGNHSASIVLTDAAGRTSSATVGIMAYGQLAVSVPSSAYVFPRLADIQAVRPVVAEGTLVPSKENPFGTFALTGALPAGLSFSQASGAITGKPTIEGSYGPFTISVTDASGQTAYTAPFTIQVAPRNALAVSVSKTSFSAYVPLQEGLLSAQNAVGNVTWSLASGTLPPGLSLAPDGFLTGTASELGSYPGLVFQGVDEDGGTAQTAPATLETVMPAEITVSASLAWTAGKPFTKLLKADNAVGDVAFSVTGSAPLPSGMALSASGVLSGTVASPVSATVAVEAKDSLGRQGTGTLDVSIKPAMTMSLAAETTVPRQTQASVVPAVQNGVGKVSFSVSGTLPDGFTFDPATGAISGTATKEGVWNGITVTATDEAANVRSASTRIVVGARNPLTVAYDFGAPLLVNMFQGLPKLPTEPTNAIGTVQYAVSGSLPAGLTFNRSTGAFGGMPTQTGVFAGITVTGTDSEGASATSSPFSIAVSSSGEISQADLTRTVRGGGFVDTGAITPSNAVYPLAFTARSPLPSGLSLVTSSGALVGVPSGNGTSVVELTVTDSIGRTASFKLSLEIVGDLSVSYANASVSQYGQPSIVPSVSNAIGAKAFSVASGTLPQGLVLDPSTGKVAGTAGTMGTKSGISISVTDEGLTGNVATSAPFSITVGARLPLQVNVGTDQPVIANKAFLLQPKAVNAVETVAWSKTGQLPPGLSFDPATGKVSGTATNIGTWSATFTATDQGSGTFTTPLVSFQVMTDGLPIRLTTYPVTAKPGIAFAAQTPKVSNAVGDVSFTSSDLAAYGLSIDPSTGVVSGSVSQITQITVNIKVTDSSNRLTSEPVTINVIPNLRITVREGIETTVSTSMPSVRPITDYAIGAVAYELVGRLPTGLSFNPASGAISGTPAEIGVFDGLYVKGTDSVGDTATSQAFKVTVYESGVVPSLSVAVPSEITAGVTAVNVTPTWTPKKVGDAFTINKPLPAGLSLDPATGKITGVATVAAQGVYDGYVLAVTDVSGKQGLSSEFTIKVKNANQNSFQSQTIAVRANQPFESSPPVYSHDAIVGTLTYAKVSGFPASVSLDPETGVVRGKVAASARLTVSPRDSIGTHGNFDVNVNVSSPTIVYVGSPIAIEVGQERASAPPVVTNIAGAPRFNVASGTLPSGLSLDVSTGQLRGILGTAGYSGYIQVAVTDDFGTAVSNAFQILGQVLKPDPFSWPNVAAAEPGALVTAPSIKLTGLTANPMAAFSSSNGTGFLSSCSSSCMTYSNGEAPKVLGVGSNVYPKVTASTQYGGVVTATVTVGGVVSTWTVTTRLKDIMPDDFNFADANGVNKGQSGVPSGIVQITGINEPAALTISGPAGTTYRLGTSPAAMGSSVPAGSATTIANGQYLQISTTAANADDTPVTVNVTVGDMTKSWTVRTRPFSDMPDAFSFVDQTDVRPAGGIVSNRVLIKGISEAVPVQLSGNSLSMFWSVCDQASGGACVSWPAGTAGKTITEGKYLELTMRTSDSFETTVSMNLQVGGRAAAWNLKTRAANIAPTQFSFTAATMQPRSRGVATPYIQIRGFIDPSPVSVTGPAGTQFMVCASAGSGCTAWKNAGTAYSILPDQYLVLTTVSSAVNDGVVTVTANIGGVSADWNVYTAPRDEMPDAISFPDQINAAPNNTYQSAIRQVTGIIDPVTAAVSGSATARIQVCGSTSTSSCGASQAGPLTIQPNQYLRLETKSGANGATVPVSLQLGDLAVVWKVTTVP